MLWTVKLTTDELHDLRAIVEHNLEVSTSAAWIRTAALILGKLPNPDQAAPTPDPEPGNAAKPS